jgi:hypothetical protein
MSWSGLYGTGGKCEVVFNVGCWLRDGCGDEGVLGEVVAWGFCAPEMSRSMIKWAISGYFEQNLAATHQRRENEAERTIKVFYLAFVPALPIASGR